jgi:hypothetical protein
LLPFSFGTWREIRNFVAEKADCVVTGTMMPAFRRRMPAWLLKLWGITPRQELTANTDQRFR